MSTPFIGEIKLVGFNFAPRGFAWCSGQLLAISQNDVLFALIGTTYGGDGQNTFALPDLRGRVPVHMGTGPGLTSRTIGEQGGTENVTLNSSQIPTHAHTGVTTKAGGTAQAVPSGAVPATGGPDLYAASRDISGSMTLGAAGGSQPHANVAPILTINFVIALEGIFPSRN